MPDANSMRRSVQSQIKELQGQIRDLQGSIASQGSDLYDATEESARAAMKQVRRQATAMGQVARENPGSTATILSIVALTCIGLGYLAGRAGDNNHWQDR